MNKTLLNSTITIKTYKKNKQNTRMFSHTTPGCFNTEHPDVLQHNIPMFYQQTYLIDLLNNYIQSFKLYIAIFRD